MCKNIIKSLECKISLYMYFAECAFSCIFFVGQSYGIAVVTSTIILTYYIKCIVQTQIVIQKIHKQHITSHEHQCMLGFCATKCQLMIRMDIGRRSRPTTLGKPF